MAIDGLMVTGGGCCVIRFRSAANSTLPHWATGEAGLLWVTASLDSGTYYRKTVYVSRQLLAKNLFLDHDPSFPRTWGVNPKYLESAAPQRKW